MYTWINQMPQGMRLKSEGFASSLYDPEGNLTLERYCSQEGIPYADIGLPVKLDTFASYGMAFQKRFVPELEEKTVTALSKSAEGFELSLNTGENLSAKQVIVAAGITHFGYIPPAFSGLPKEFLTHSAQYGVLDQFRGREVAVIGAGASALDIAALLHEAGASAQVVARKSVIRFHDPPVLGPKPLLQRLRFPATGIGVGWWLMFYSGAPWAFHKMPESFRLRAVRKTLGPAPGWFVKEQVVGKVPLNLGFDVKKVSLQDGRVKLDLESGNGEKKSVMADHVIAATGYKVDLRRLCFLDSKLMESIRSIEHAPVLNANFQSSVPGLYFVGTAAANSFGPLMRFAFGARFTAENLSKHLAKSVSRAAVPSRLAASLHTLERG
jgi:cation diffusion facilitator CzcD-associated flavoprotein CzcO